MVSFSQLPALKNGTICDAAQTKLGPSYFGRRPQKLTKSIWHYIVSVKSTVNISSIFVTFLENTNFNETLLYVILVAGFQTKFNLLFGLFFTKIFQKLSNVIIWIIILGTSTCQSLKRFNHRRSGTSMPMLVIWIFMKALEKDIIYIFNMYLENCQSWDKNDKRTQCYFRIF